MCLSKVYVNRNNKRELLLEEIASVEIVNGKLVFKTLFGEQKEIEANIREIDFLSHSLVVENLGGGLSE
jgi:predicted RNA-binding protein